MDCLIIGCSTPSICVFSLLRFQNISDLIDDVIFQCFAVVTNLNSQEVLRNEKCHDAVMRNVPVVCSQYVADCVKRKMLLSTDAYVVRKAVFGSYSKPNVLS